MRNAGPDYFYRKNLRVGAYGKRLEAPDARHAADRAFEVSFHPEGGYLLAGVRCCVGFKALRGDGTAARVTGRIEDDRGVEVVRFESRHAGLGKLFFTPEAGRSYTAVCRNEATGEQRRFRLAAVQSKGCIVQVFPASERFTVQVAAPAGQDTRGLGLLIHCRGRLCWAGAWEGRPLSFARDRFPDGVLQVLLLDAAGRSLSERLLFCYDPRRQPAIAVRTDKPAYGRREKITVHLRCTDAAGNPCGGDLSVAVTDNRMVDPYRPGDIRTALLLESELRGYIEDPAWYFDERHPERLAQVDALMLTQGWRRYDIPKALRGEYALPSEPLEIGQEITGRIRKTGLFRRRNFTGYTVDMLAPARGVFATSRVDSAGAFALNGFDLPDSTLCVLRASGRDGREDVELLIDEPTYPEPRRLPVPGYGETMLRYNANIGRFTDSLKNILIEEVIIRGTPRKLPQTPYEVLARRSVDYTQIEQQGYSNIKELLIRQGVSEIRGVLTYRGKPIMFVVDGIIQDDRQRMFEPTVEDVNTGSGTKSYKFQLANRKSLRSAWAPTLTNPIREFDYNAIPIDFVKQIDLIPPGNTALFGVRVNGGAVVVITSKDGTELLKGKREDMDRLHIRVFDPHGYQQPVEFYSPRYETAQERNAPERDLRTTLYWNPRIRVKPDGNASFSFYSADEPADYAVDVQGSVVQRTPLPETTQEATTGASVCRTVRATALRIGAGN